MHWAGIIETYREFLPVTYKTPVITLLEGNTPLIPAPGLLGEGKRLYLKYEGLNPTGSFKDRGMTMAVSKAVEEGARTVICASTGNTSASAAAYAARAGISCVVVVPQGTVARGKLAQALTHGAKVISLQGNFDAALSLVREVAASRKDVVLVNSVNPYRLEGQKTAALEIIKQLGKVPTHLALPVGNAGNITAYWMGFCQYRGRMGAGVGAPHMLGFQAAGAAPLVLGHPVEAPETVATAIRIGRPASWDGAVKALSESNGKIEAVSDAEILEAYHLLARKVGVFAEPASAAPVAGILRMDRQGSLPDGATVVVILTGHGLKDPEIAIRLSAEPVVLPATKEALEALLERETEA